MMGTRYCPGKMTLNATFGTINSFGCACEAPGPGNAQACEDAASTFPDGQSFPGGPPCKCLCHRPGEVWCSGCCQIHPGPPCKGSGDSSAASATPEETP